MKILIDCRLASTSTRGMARYCREIVKSLISLDKNNDVYLVISKDTNDFGVLPENFHFIKTRSENYILSEQIDLPRIVRKVKPDILWCTSNTFPIFLRKKTKLFVTIHDLIFMDKLPGKLSIYKKIGALYRKFVVKNFSYKIYEYFTVSEYSKVQIEKRLGITDKGIVTSNCLSSDFASIAAKYITEQKENYYFTVSGDGPSKNLSFLIKAFSNELKNEKLFVAGLSANSEYRTIKSNNIIFMDVNLSDDAIIEKYCKCKAFIFPSLEEGFGLPIIEALCCKAKVIASNRSCIPEVVGDNGKLFNPENVNSLVDVINNLETDVYKYNYSKYDGWIKTAEIVYNEFNK